MTESEDKSSRNKTDNLELDRVNSSNNTPGELRSQIPAVCGNGAVEQETLPASNGREHSAETPPPPYIHHPNGIYM